jgi:hypothetical protein
VNNGHISNVSKMDKVLYLKCMSENGIKKIEDLIDDNNRFLTYQMFLDKCNVNINAITYYGIISNYIMHCFLFPFCVITCYLEVYDAEV